MIMKTTTIDIIAIYTILFFFVVVVVIGLLRLRVFSSFNYYYRNCFCCSIVLVLIT